MRTMSDLTLETLMAFPTLLIEFGSCSMLEEQIAKMRIDKRADDRDGIVGLIRRHLTDIYRPRLSRIKEAATTCLPYILMCVSVSLITLPSQSSILANMAKGGTIKGKLTDPSGKAVEAAHVIATIQNPSTPSSGKSFETYSNSAGVFKLTNLPVGIYNVKVRAFGFKPQTIDLVQVAESKTTNLSISIEIVKVCGDTKDSSSIFKEDDKAEMVRQILERVFVIKDLPGPRFLLYRGKQIVLSTEQVNPSSISNHAQVEFLLLDKQKITEMASKTGDFQYLRFSGFRTNGPCTAVTLTCEWEVDKNSNRSYFGSNGYMYEFHKIGDKWVGKFAGGWIS